MSRAGSGNFRGRRVSWWSEWWRPQVSRGGWSVEWGFFEVGGGPGGLSGGGLRFLDVGGVLSGDL